MQIQPRFINTILLGGSLEQKLAAASAAGFRQVELWQQDLEQFPGGVSALKKCLRRQNIGLTDYQVLLDFDGAPDTLRKIKRDQALNMLEHAYALEAGTILVPASTDFACQPERIVDDMRWLAREAALRGLRVAHEAMAWSTVHPTIPDVWRVIQEVNEPNLGLVVDAFHLYVRQRPLSDLDGIPLDRIYLVQLSDLSMTLNPANVVDIARHHRLLPGEGHFPLHALLARLQGYEGPVGLEVFNDDLKSMEPETVARMAMSALSHLLEAQPNG